MDDEIRDAIIDGQLDRVRKALEAGLSPDSYATLTGNTFQSFIYFAAKYGQLPIEEHLKKNDTRIEHEAPKNR